MSSDQAKFVYSIFILAAAMCITPAQASSDSPKKSHLPISSLSWFTGCWREDRSGGQIEEYWMSPQGQTMLGMSRMVADGKTEFFESWHIREHEDRILATVTISGKQQVEFELIESQDRKAVFQTPAITPPERLIYQRKSDDTLHARLEKQREGKLTTEEFTLKRADCAQTFSGSMPMIAQNIKEDKQMETAATNVDRAITKEILVSASLKDVWEAWTTSKGAATFFAPKTNIKLAIGGPYEITFDPKDERQGTKGLKILSYVPEEMISFQWNAPPDMPNVRKIGTWVVVQLSQPDAQHVKVKLTHLGWQEGEEWDKAFQYFTRAWSIVMGNLERRFSQGPIDWNKS